jgi:KDO2-lipid IV(A) lauroyltransferase
MNQATPIPTPGAKATTIPLTLRLRYWAETAGFFLVIGFFRLFRVERASAIGGWIGRNLVAPTSLSRLAIENLNGAFPDKSDAEIAAILRAMWDNLGRVMGEYSHLDRFHSGSPNARVELTGTENLDTAKATGKPLLLISAHFANWEVMQFALHDNGIRGAPVVRPANNPYVNRWLEAARIRNGMPEQIPKHGGTRRVFTLLRKGASICMFVDQRASEGILVPFFGRNAFTTPLPAALALKLGAVIVPISSVRLPGARFRMHAYPMLEMPDTGDHDRDIVEITATLNRFIEERIRERPGEWLWIHRRWVGDDAPLRKRAQILSPGRGGTSNATSNRV